MVFSPLFSTVPFDTFREKLAEYVFKTFTSARNVIPLVEDMEDPMNEFRDNNKPRIKRKRKEEDKKSEKKIKSESSGVLVTSDSGDELDEDDGVTYYDPDDFVEKLMLDTKIKAYVAGEEVLKNNISKVHDIVWGQCTSNLQAVIKGDHDFETKNKKRDVLWLFGQIKIVTAGIDNKSNKYKNLQTALLQLLTMCQGETEANDKFLNRFKSNVQTVELSGGK